jgi:hypothetical protein
MPSPNPKVNESGKTSYPGLGRFYPPQTPEQLARDMEQVRELLKPITSVEPNPQSQHPPHESPQTKWWRTSR